MSKEQAAARLREILTRLEDGGYGEGEGFDALELGTDLGTLGSEIIEQITL